MIRKIITGGIGTAIALSVVLPVAAGSKKPVKQAKTVKDQTLYCPIMDIKMKRSEAKSSIVKGKTYYFCCAFCKKQFDKDPVKNAVKYNAKMAALKKGAKKSGQAKAKKAGDGK